MIVNITNPFVIASLGFVLSAVLTFLVREIARKKGIVAKPKSDRWHKKPTAMLGGVAIYFSTVATALVFIVPTLEFWVVLGGSTLMFLLGLIDDIFHIKPYQKLIGQFISAALVIGYGMVLPWSDSQLLNIMITAFWLIGITNALNLLDNMDGLAAGIAAIAAFTLAAGADVGSGSVELLLLSAFIGVLVGFLIYNFNPASIFMGDCGSLFVGFLLACSVMLNQTGGRSRSVFTILAVPVLTLFVPIFDTTFVTVLRKVWGRKASQGGRDHTSHRLVALGLTERSAVLLLYGLAMTAGILSIVVRHLEMAQSIALVTLFTIVLSIIGVYLAKVKVYEEQQEELALQDNALHAFLFNLSHKRRIFEVCLDVGLISLAYYGSYVIVLGDFETTSNWELFIKTLPVLIVLKLAAFLAVGVYRGIWRYTSIGDLVTFFRGVALGSVLSVMAILALYRFEGFSRAVFFIDAVLLFLGLAGSRMAFRLFREILPNPVNREGRRVLIYGAGDGGELVLRELYNNPDWNYNPIGFIDDDPLKKDKLIHGLKVFGGNGSLESICRERDVQEILISTGFISGARLKEIRQICKDSNIALKRASLKIEPLDFG
jgi:UDP-GlcNAc:undecaprenyl-phosphate GlcNAc-1-phosphate transferase